MTSGDKLAELDAVTFKQYFADSVNPFRMLATIEAQAREIARYRRVMENIELGDNLSDWNSK